jgi:hypothetical protein
MKRRAGDVDPWETLRPLADHLADVGFARMSLAMVLYGRDDRSRVMRSLERRLDVTVVQTGPVPSRSDVVCTRSPPRGKTSMSIAYEAARLCRSLRTTRRG